MSRRVFISGFVAGFLIAALLGVGVGRMSVSSASVQQVGDDDFVVTFNLKDDESKFDKGDNVGGGTDYPPGIDIAMKNLARVQTGKDPIEVVIFTEAASSSCVWYRGSQYCP